MALGRWRCETGYVYRRALPTCSLSSPDPSLPPPECVCLGGGGVQCAVGIPPPHGAQKTLCVRGTPLPIPSRTHSAKSPPNCSNASTAMRNGTDNNKPTPSSHPFFSLKGARPPGAQTYTYFGRFRRAVDLFFFGHFLLFRRAVDLLFSAILTVFGVRLIYYVRTFWPFSECG